jgi:hypothetical protein
VEATWSSPNLNLECLWTSVVAGKGVLISRPVLLELRIKQPACVWDTRQGLKTRQVCESVRPSTAGKGQCGGCQIEEAQRELY